MRTASNGEAMKIEEYAPEKSPMSRARANSSRVVAPSTNEPRTSSDATGSSAVMEVFRERMSTWFSDRLTMPPYVRFLLVPTSGVFSSTLSNTTMPS